MTGDSVRLRHTEAVTGRPLRVTGRLSRTAGVTCYRVRVVTGPPAAAGPGPGAQRRRRTGAGALMIIILEVRVMRPAAAALTRRSYRH